MSERYVNLNGGGHICGADQADMRALELAHWPKTAKLARRPRLRAEVERRLGGRWSPEQVGARLKVDVPDDVEMRASHETIFSLRYARSAIVPAGAPQLGSPRSPEESPRE